MCGGKMVNTADGDNGYRRDISAKEKITKDGQ